jgi:ATP-dependent protease ClpP protease subunit
MNGADVTVNINSPGGDMFEGLAIYNLLREYEGRVTVKVLGHCRQRRLDHCDGRG